MDAAPTITSAARAIVSLAPALGALADCPAERAAAEAASSRGHFRPDEESVVRAWFARYQTVRGGLLEVIDELRPLTRDGIDDTTRLRSFLVAYAAACLLVRAGRILVHDLATNKVVQRKLNEADPEHRLPRKGYTRIYRSLTDPAHAWRLSEAMRFADDRREDLETIAAIDPLLSEVLAYLAGCEDALRVSLRDYLRARLRYRWHSYRRRRASAAQRGLFRIAEAFGRVIAEMRAPGHRDRVTDRHRAELAELLRPGDVVITRHDHAFSNLFLPGYWPHAALHVGARQHAERLGAVVEEPQAGRWVDPLRVLEARKDGVRLRTLDDTFSVDAFAVLRPTLGEREIGRALTNALRHEGKEYNFDFDFFSSDRLVCTEVVYRAYEGVGDIAFTLRSRAGRPTLSAEDVIDMALLGRGFEVAAVYGTPGTGSGVLRGTEGVEALRRLRG